MKVIKDYFVLTSCLLLKSSFDQQEIFYFNHNIIC